MAWLDLDDTSRCPLGEVCAGCGLPVPDRRVWTARGFGGVMCLTLCGSCQVFGAPRMSTLDSVRAVVAHCGHLGITLDEMGELLDAESDQEGR